MVKSSCPPVYWNRCCLIGIVEASSPAAFSEGVRDRSGKPGAESEDLERRARPDAPAEGNAQPGIEMALDL